jgi:hypothetical protein
MTRRLPALLLLAVALGSIAAAQAAGSLPGVVSSCVTTRSPQVRPRSIVLACGDGNLYLAGLTWSGWTARSATGAGLAHVNDCNPYCAAGHFHTYPVTVRLSRPATCRTGKRPQFTRLVYRYAGTKPAGARSSLYTYPCR